MLFKCIFLSILIIFAFSINKLLKGIHCSIVKISFSDDIKIPCMYSSLEEPSAKNFTEMVMYLPTNFSKLLLINMEFFINPTQETIRTNILKTIIFEQPIEDIKRMILKLEKTNFDLTKEIIIFDNTEYGIINVG